MKRDDTCLSLLIDPDSVDIETVFEWCTDTFGDGFLVDEVRTSALDPWSSGWPFRELIRFTSSDVNAVAFKLRWSEFIVQ